MSRVVGGGLALLLWATPAWALPIGADPAITCAASGGSWWKPAWAATGTCFSPRTDLTPRETFTPREDLTPRLDPPLVLPATGGGAIVGGGDALPLQPTPEPGTLMLVGTTLAGIGVWWRMRRGR